MHAKDTKIYLIFSLFVLLSTGAKSSADPFQLFLDPLSEAVCHQPLEVELLVLNDKGEIENGFTGEYELRITARESGRNEGSYRIRSRQVDFDRGRGVLIIENDEEETLLFHVTIASPPLSGSVEIHFEDRDLSPPQVTEIYADDPGLIRLQFDEELEEESAQEVRNFKAVTNEREVYPESIEYRRDYVILKFADHFHGDEEGYIEMEGIKDLKGNEIRSGTRSPDFVGTCSDACPDA